MHTIDPRKGNTQTGVESGQIDSRSGQLAGDLWQIATGKGTTGKPRLEKNHAEPFGHARADDSVRRVDIVRQAKTGNIAHLKLTTKPQTARASFRDPRTLPFGSGSVPLAARDQKRGGG